MNPGPSARSIWINRLARLKDRFIDFRRNRLAFVGMLIIILMLLIAILAPQIQMHDPLEMNTSNRLQKPNMKHILGTDQFGRDVWSRIVNGSRVALIVGLLSVGIGIVFGTPIGAVAGYYRGRVDEVTMRAMDAFLAIPPMLMALVIVAILGSGIFKTMIAIGIVYIPRFARVIRASVMVEREREYVEAAKIVGESDLSILFRGILPNCLSPMIVQATVFIAAAILTEAALSFLGLGIEPPDPSWGSMLNEARLFMESDPLQAIMPGLAISITVFGFNIFGDGLRDILDPRLAER